jgi:hypothetical protein
VALPGCASEDVIPPFGARDTSAGISILSFLTFQFGIVCARSSASTDSKLNSSRPMPTRFSRRVQNEGVILTIDKPLAGNLPKRVYCLGVFQHPPRIGGDQTV